MIPFCIKNSSPEVNSLSEILLADHQQALFLIHDGTMCVLSSWFILGIIIIWFSRRNWIAPTYDASSMSSLHQNPAILAFQTKVLRTLLQYRQNIEAKDCLS